MRALWMLFLVSASSWACSCINTSTPCSHLGGSTAIFVARVLTDSGEGLGKGPAHVAIEEPLQNVPVEQHEADIDTASLTSCYFRLKAGERYVIISDGPKYSVAACSNSFQLRGNEHILEALRSQVRGGPPRLVGTVLKSTGAYSRGGGLDGVSVIAESNGVRRQTTTDGLGQYVFPALEPGRYRIEISKAGYTPDSKYNERWSGRMQRNSETNTFEPDKSDPGLVFIPEKACSIWNLSMWPAGSIKGTVTGRTGVPLGGVTVQAFQFDKNSKSDSSPLKTTVTTANGTYSIDSLPEGSYAVGINGRTYNDDDVYPQTLYEAGKANYLSESGTLEGINIVLPPARTPAQLKIVLTGPDGLPHSGATVKLENLQGIQRYFSSDKSGTNGEIRAPTYVGEHYIVRAFHYMSGDSDETERLFRREAEQHSGMNPNTLGA